MIDWSSAPDGATHLDGEGLGWLKGKTVGNSDIWYLWSLNGWVKTSFEFTADGIKRFDARPSASKKTDTHYNNTLRVPVTQADAEKGYVEVKLDPYIVQRTCNITDPVLQHIHKKAQRGTAKGHTMLELLTEIKQSAQRGIELEELIQ